MRLFVAIKIEDHIRAGLAKYIQELRQTAPEVKWVRAENLHVTLKFLGHIEEAKLAAIEELLGLVKSATAVSLEFRGFGFFPNNKRPRVFWVDMGSSPNLKALASDVDNAMHKLGLPLESRPFTPHLTLARFESTLVPQELFAQIGMGIDRSFGSMTTNQFHLVESKLKPTGAEYTILHSFTFAVANRF